MIDMKDFVGTELEAVADLAAGAHAAYEANEISGEELKEILQDIRHAAEIEEQANKTVTVGKLLAGIDAISKVL